MCEVQINIQLHGTASQVLIFISVDLFDLGIFVCHANVMPHRFMRKKSQSGTVILGGNTDNKSARIMKGIIFSASEPDK